MYACIIAKVSYSGWVGMMMYLANKEQMISNVIPIMVLYRKKILKASFLFNINQLLTFLIKL